MAIKATESFIAEGDKFQPFPKVIYRAYYMFIRLCLVITVTSFHFELIDTHSMYTYEDLQSLKYGLDIKFKTQAILFLNHKILNMF